ncbi:MAG: Glyoxalase/Bleomycin resistance protein/Dioxygenase superfamily [Chloroflexota bacterium]|jgi:catechol 2,3-dioxygenase-like lactoylglutathione lyase family enzyme|nr:Glyoxalase/Bleomycin resistance protein/Dioxygenase superfamily [Chloroflexota bacterium]
MAIDDPRPGAVHFIDHYAVPTADLMRWQQFMQNALGGVYYYTHGLVSREEARGARPRTFYWVGAQEIGGFLQRRALPAPGPLGRSYPRFGYWTRQAELDAHRRRFDALGVAASDPVRTSEDGEPGTAVYFTDPDGNQYELWAPDELPEAAMEGGNALGLGRISHAVLESTDLDRTTDFYGRFCAVEPIQSADIPKDTVAFRLAGGGRLVFKQVEAIGARTGGHETWEGQHAALTVRPDEWELVHRRIWDGLPSDRFMQHPKVARGEMEAKLELGGYFYDWDGNSYHFNRWHGQMRQDGPDARTYGRNPFGVNPH